MMTSCFKHYTGPGRISIARFVPLYTPPGFRIYQPLAPGPWFKSVSRTEYERLYAEQLAALDPNRVVEDLTRLAAGAEPTLLCWETLKRPGEWVATDVLLALGSNARATRFPNAMTIRTYRCSGTCNDLHVPPALSPADVP